MSKMSKKIDFAVKLAEMIDESQQELDAGIYGGDYDVFCFMEECDVYIKGLRAEIAKYKEAEERKVPRLHELYADQQEQYIDIRTFAQFVLDSIIKTENAGYILGRNVTPEELRNAAKKVLGVDK